MLCVGISTDGRTWYLPSEEMTELWVRVSSPRSPSLTRRRELGKQNESKQIRIDATHQHWGRCADSTPKLFSQKEAKIVTKIAEMTLAKCFYH